MFKFSIRLQIVLIIIFLFLIFFSKPTLGFINIKPTVPSVWQSNYTQILEVHLRYSYNPDLQVSVTNMRKLTGFIPLPELLTAHAYLTLSEQNGVEITNWPLFLPKSLSIPRPLDETDSFELEADLPLQEIAITLPWIPSAYKLSVKNNNSELIFQELIAKIPIIEAEPSLESKVDSFFLSSDGFLDIVFVGDDYTIDQSDLFLDDVDRFIFQLQTYKPFSTRQSELRFTPIFNTTDLGCRIVNGRLAVCNDGIITEIVNNSGIPYDKIVVIYNTDTYSGSGGAIAVAYNGSSGPYIFVHEFGHSLAELVDEYLAYYNYARRDRNCYEGIPPNPNWEGVVDDSDYYLECNFPDWYRSSYDSIMRRISSSTFNPISQVYLSQAFDYYVNLDPSPSPSPYPANCFAGDNMINLDDVYVFYENYLKENQNIDTEDNGIINTFEFSYLAKYWLQSCNR